MNTHYGYIIGSQYSPTYIEYITSKAGEQVQWSILDTGSTHNKVLDALFTDNNRKGQITIGRPDSNPGTIDLSQFQTGSLRFDIRVTDFGDAYDAQARGVVFVARMDCLWPCAAHETQFVIPTVDAWTNINLPIADLIATGLDISKISASLVLVPRGNQANLHIQLDNVQLIKGGPVTAGPVVIFNEDFNKKVFPEWKITNVAGNASTTVTTNFGFGATLNFIWQGANNIVRFDTTLDNSIDITNKHASFQINCWENTAMNFSFQMVSTDVNGNTETTDANYATSLSVDTWYKVSADFGSVFSGSYDPKHINKIGVQFNYLDTAAASTICQVDTIRITE